MEIELDHDERNMILSYGYPDPSLQSTLKKLSRSRQAVTIVIDSLDAEQLSGDLARSMNHGEIPDEELEFADALCERLESLGKRAR